jgi:dihydroorotase
MDDSMLQGYDRNLKVRPPLRGSGDIKALLDGLKSGIIDCVATDHAPHNEIDKQVEFNFAPPGMIGLQTAFSHLYTELVMPGKIELAGLVRSMTSGPASALGIPGGRMEAGAPADLAVIDLSEEWTFDAENNRSTSCNSPLMGRTLTGRVKGVFLGGKWKKVV